MYGDLILNRIVQVLVLASERQIAAGDFEGAAQTLRSTLDYCPRFVPAVTAYAQLLAKAFRNFDAS